MYTPEISHFTQTRQIAGSYANADRIYKYKKLLLYQNSFNEPALAGEHIYILLIITYNFPPKTREMGGHENKGKTSPNPRNDAVPRTCVFFDFLRSLFLLVCSVLSSPPTQ